MRGHERHIRRLVVLLEHAGHGEHGLGVHYRRVAAHGGQRDAQVVDKVIDLLFRTDHQHPAGSGMTEHAPQPCGLILGEWRRHGRAPLSGEIESGQAGFAVACVA